VVTRVPCDEAVVAAPSYFKGPRFPTLRASSPNTSASATRLSERQRTDRIPNLQNGICRAWILLVADSLCARRQSRCVTNHSDVGPSGVRCIVLTRVSSRDGPSRWGSVRRRTAIIAWSTDDDVVSLISVYRSGRGDGDRQRRSVLDVPITRPRPGACGLCPSDRCITGRAPQLEGIRVRPAAVRIGSRRYGRDTDGATSVLPCGNGTRYW